MHLFGVILMLIVASSAVWVYWDATAHKIGRRPDGKGLSNTWAGVWGTATLLIWIIGFPLYLGCRAKLIEKAQEFPVAVKGRAIKLAIFVIIGLFLVLSRLGSPA